MPKKRKKKIKKKQKKSTQDDGQDNGYTVTKNKLHPIARIILMGVYDDNNIWSTIGGMKYIIKEIWELSLDPNNSCFKSYIDTKHAWSQIIAYDLEFPSPTDININMMPFIITAQTFEQSMLPKKLKKYWKMISICTEKVRFQTVQRQIGFLTIQESLVDKGKTQRRPGLHVETPGYIYLNGDKLSNNEEQEIYQKGGGTIKNMSVQEIKRVSNSYWGRGNYKDVGAYKDIISGGIYMASSVNNSCAVWNCKIVADKDERQVIGHLGDIEHLRSNLPDDRRQIMKGNVLYWITDTTPHEALAMKKSGYRQFFRVVTHDVSVWYEQHSTWNPNGLMPDPKITRIVKGNKFDLQYDSFDETDF